MNKSDTKMLNFCLNNDFVGLVGELGMMIHGAIWEKLFVLIVDFWLGQASAITSEGNE